MIIFKAHIFKNLEVLRDPLGGSLGVFSEGIVGLGDEYTCILIFVLAFS